MIGVLSDTHGSLHPGVLPLFRDAKVEAILHAGDVGAARVLEQLAELAPTYAVRGNVDTSGSMALLPEEFRIEWEGVTLYVTHIGDKPNAWLPRLGAHKPGVVICGHSHIPLLKQTGGVLFLNPGAAGTTPRFGRPLTAALLTLENGSAKAEIVTL